MVSVPVRQATARGDTSKDFVPPLVFQAAGPTAASIQGMVEAFRAALGNPNNGNASTLIEYFDADCELLFSSFVPASPGDGSLSFFGIVPLSIRTASEEMRSSNREAAVEVQGIPGTIGWHCTILWRDQEVACPALRATELTGDPVPAILSSDEEKCGDQGEGDRA